MKKEMVKFLIGHRDGVTIIGPSTVVKEIRRNPNKIELLTVPGLEKRSFSVGRKTTRKKTTRKTTRRTTARGRRR
jgi:hypothetical protein